MSTAHQCGRRGAAAAIGVTAFAAAMVVLVAGCGGGSSSKNAAATGTSTSASGSSTGSGSVTASGSGAPRGGQADFQAYSACLSQHGVKVPTFSGRPNAAASGSRRPRPSGSFVRPTGSFSRPPGGFGGAGGGFLGSASADPSTQAAMQACASLLPQGGFGGGRGGGAGGADGAGGAISATTFAAFKSCMSDNGVTITGTDAQAAIRSLDRSDAKTAAALKVCQPILGTAAAGAVPSPSPSN